MANILQRAKAAVSAFRFSGMGGSYGMWPLLMPSTAFNYEQAAGDPTGNSIVMASLLWIMRAFPEGRIEVLQESDRGHAKQRQHPLTQLVSRPNPGYSGTLLMQATTISLNLAGNAYWVKLRNRYGVPVQLWYVPHFQMSPRWPGDGSRFISHYEYRLQNERIVIPADDVVHFRNGIDPNNTRLGMSPLASAYREIFTDNEAANFGATILRNMGIPGIIISPSHPDAKMDDPEHIKQLFLSKFSGDKRGEPLVLDGGVKVDMLSFSPEQMNLRDLRRIPEERISALLGVPAMVAGLGAGLERSTFTNMSEARLMAYESNIVPTYRMIADELDRSLLPELGNPDDEHVNFDTRLIRVLQDDRNMLYQRESLVWTSGITMRSEGRLAIGLTAGPEDDIYITDLIPPALPTAGKAPSEKGPAAPKP